MCITLVRIPFKSKSIVYVHVYMYMYDGSTQCCVFSWKQQMHFLGQPFVKFKMFASLNQKKATPFEMF